MFQRWLQRINRQNVNNQYIKFKLPILKDSYLIQWNPESHTIIHDHNGKDCDFMMLNRNVLECRYQELDRETIYLTRELQPFLKYNVKKGVFHQMKNADKDIKWSLHRYY